MVEERLYFELASPQEVLHHYARYIFASQYCKNKVVVDVACGIGYGTDFLSNYALTIFGIDKTIEYAKTYYNNKACFLESNLETSLLPFESETIDIVVSFETIEHINNVKFFLSEIHRILKEGGTLILSSPYPRRNESINPFHVYEHSIKEMRSLLSNFTNLKTYDSIINPVIGGRFLKWEMRTNIKKHNFNPFIRSEVYIIVAVK